MPTPFNENFRNLMEKKGITSKEMSSRTGIAVNTINSYRGRSDKFAREPLAINLYILAKELGVTMDELYGGDE